MSERSGKPGKSARRLPNGAKEILQDFVVAVLRGKVESDQFLRFAVNWFQRALDEEEKKNSDQPSGEKSRADFTGEKSRADVAGGKSAANVGQKDPSRTTLDVDNKPSAQAPGQSRTTLPAGARSTLDAKQPDKQPSSLNQKSQNNLGGQQASQNNFGAQQQPSQNFGGQPASQNNLGGQSQNNFGGQSRNNLGEQQPSQNFAGQQNNQEGQAQNNFGGQSRNNLGGQSQNNLGGQNQNNYGGQSQNNFAGPATSLNNVAATPSGKEQATDPSAGGFNFEAKEGDSRQGFQEGNQVQPRQNLDEPRRSGQNLQAGASRPNLEESAGNTENYQPGQDRDGLRPEPSRLDGGLRDVGSRNEGLGERRSADQVDQTRSDYPGANDRANNLHADNNRQPEGDKSAEHLNPAIGHHDDLAHHPHQTASQQDQGQPGDDPNNPQLGNRRQGVSAESYDPEKSSDEPDKVYPKSDEQLQRVREAVKEVLLFRSLDEDHLRKVVDALEEVRVGPGDEVIKIGDEKADSFFVIEEGEFECFANVKGNLTKVMEYNNRGSFGELALMYNQPRAATVRAKTPGRLWALDRDTFRKIIVRGAYEKRKLYMSLMEQVDFLADLQDYEKQNVCDALQPRKYQAGDVVMKQGDEGDGMYFVETGEVVCVRKEGDSDQEVGRAKPGQYVGELALIAGQPRAATVIATEDGTKLAFLDSKAFERLMGPCIDLLRKNVDRYKDKIVAVFGENTAYLQGTA